jgi:hypothetical protein
LGLLQLVVVSYHLIALCLSPAATAHGCASCDLQAADLVSFCAQQKPGADWLFGWIEAIGRLLAMTLDCLETLF